MKNNLECLTLFFIAQLLKSTELLHIFVKEHKTYVYIFNSSHSF